LLNLSVQLGGAEGQIENVCMLSTTDHTLLEFSAIFSDNIFDAKLLKGGCRLKVLNKDLIATEVANCTV
jgi:hypothetical protein